MTHLPKHVADLPPGDGRPRADPATVRAESNAGLGQQGVEGLDGVPLVEDNPVLKDEIPSGLRLNIRIKQQASHLTQWIFPIGSKSSSLPLLLKSVARV